MILSYVTAHQLLNRVAKVSDRSRILIHGAGGAVGTAMLELAQLRQIEVYGTASLAKHKTVRERGGIPIDYKGQDFTEAILTLGDPGVDAVFDPIGGEHLTRSFRVTRDRGILVAYGFQNAVQGKGGNVLLDLLRLKVWNWLPNGKSTAFYSIGATRKSHPQWFKEDLTFLFQLLKGGKVDPVIDRIISLEGIPDAHRRIEAGEPIGKIVVRLRK
ncbi:MAG TPA: zinc-binding dehydrogenase [Oceanipulchritudo sp.]|nr:zinc-binding dehydrogenase [Oceanipulchritudo sp.]